VSRGDPTDDEVAHAWQQVFGTQPGAVIHARLTQVATTLSALKAAPGGMALVDQRGTDMNEGRRWLAIECLGAPAAAQGGSKK